jgi:nitrogen regulatory protein PII-like uncharacterized protein
MINPRDDVLITYAHLAPGTTMSGQLCPKCDGGNSNESAMSVGRTAYGLWWKCHRASCGFVGNHSMNGATTTNNDLVKPKFSRSFKREAIPFALEEALFNLYSIDGETMDRAKWAYTADYDGHGARVIFPIYGPDGEMRGEVFRSYSGDQPKTFTVSFSGNDNMMCWYRYKKYGKVLVIVEDIPSALRVAQDNKVDAVALLGTVLNYDRVKEIRDQGYERIWLCLDNDATYKAIKLKMMFDKDLPGMLIKTLRGPDIKDMSYKQFEEFIREVLP